MNFQLDTKLVSELISSASSVLIVAMITGAVVFVKLRGKPKQPTPTATIGVEVVEKDLEDYIAEDRARHVRPASRKAK